MQTREWRVLTLVRVVQEGLFARLFGHVPSATDGGLERGRRMLRRFGFLRRAADPQHVGIMHQLVQKAVRQHVMTPDSACGVPHAWVPWLVEVVESVIDETEKGNGCTCFERL